MARSNAARVNASARGPCIPNITPRPYQVPAFRYWDSLRGQPGRAVEVWARRCGKDLVYASIALMLSQSRKGLYLHFLPEFAHARRTLWDGFDNEGNRFIDTVFPYEVRKSIREDDMRIELHNGAVWQLGGSDQYDRWVGGNPISLVFSEYALAHPKAWEIMRPIVRDNGGHAAFISTPRGYNHLHDMREIAKRTLGWRHSLITAFDAGVMTQAQYDEEVTLGMPEELARQEYLCDFSAANVGAILGKYIEAAEKAGRISLDPLWDMDGADIVVSSDIGFRDTAAFWFWQPVPGGFSLVDYHEGNGMDAEEWIERLQQLPWRIDTFWLPHDARAKTFQSRHSVIEQFVTAYGARRIKVSPPMKSKDKINAARTVLPRCRFDSAACAAGLLGLRDWSFKYDDNRKTYGLEPDHNWASHPADAFCYGAAMLHEHVPKPTPKQERAMQGAHETFTLDSLFADRERDSYGRRRIP
jgi:hypothetical protein